MIFSLFASSLQRSLIASIHATSPSRITLAISTNNSGYLTDNNVLSVDCKVVTVSCSGKRSRMRRSHEPILRFLFVKIDASVHARNVLVAASLLCLLPIIPDVCTFCIRRHLSPTPSTFREVVHLCLSRAFFHGLLLMNPPLPSARNICLSSMYTSPSSKMQINGHAGPHRAIAMSRL